MFREPSLWSCHGMGCSGNQAFGRAMGRDVPGTKPLVVLMARRVRHARSHCFIPVIVLLVLRLVLLLVLLLVLPLEILLSYDIGRLFLRREV
jgi:hypothetical protein